MQRPVIRWRRPVRLAGVVAGLAIAFAGVGLMAGWRVGSAYRRLRPEAEVPATATDIGLGVANNSPVLANDPSSGQFIALANRLDSPDFSCALQVSGDGGRSWAPSEGGPALPPGAEKCYAPEVAFDGAGVLYFLFVGLAGPGNHPMGAFLTTSADRARSFTPPRRILGSLNFSVRMAIDPGIGKLGRIHLVWLHASSEVSLGGFGPSPNPILTAYSDNGGQTFSTPVQVSDPARPRIVAPALALGPRHVVTVTYYDLEGDVRDYQGLEGPTWEGTWSLVVTRSSDGGLRFDQGRVAVGGLVPSERVMLIFTMPAAALVDLQDGRACLSWTDARFGDPDVLLTCSGASGRWAGPLRLNDDPRGNGQRQYLPRLSVSPQGRIDAIFYDRRSDPQNVRNDVWYASSSDGGRSFSSNARVTDSPSDSRIGQQYAGIAAEGQVEFGARLALLSDTTSFMAAWPDTRNARFSRSQQDIFTRRVDIDSTKRKFSGYLIGGSLISLGLFTVVILGSRRSASP